MNVRAPKLNFKSAVGGLKPNEKITYESYTEGGTKSTLYFGEGSDSNFQLGLIGQLIANTISISNNWGLIYVTLGDSTTTCPCTSCTICKKDDPAHCDCYDNGCTCTDCICTGGTARPTKGGSADKFTVMYYNYY